MMWPYTSFFPRWLGLWLGLVLAGSGAAQTFFEEVTDEAFGASVFSAANGMTFGDYSNDGWPDLFLAEANDFGFGGIAFLLQNVGNGRFADRRDRLPADLDLAIKGAERSSVTTTTTAIWISTRRSDPSGAVDATGSCAMTGACSTT